MLIPWQGTSQDISAGCNTSGEFTLLLPVAVLLIKAFQKITVRLMFLSNRFTMNHRVSNVGRVTTFISQTCYSSLKLCLMLNYFLSLSLYLTKNAAFEVLKLFVSAQHIPHREQTLSQLYRLITIKYQNALHLKYVTFV